MGTAIVSIIKDADVFGTDVDVFTGHDVGYLLVVVFAGMNVNVTGQATDLTAYLFYVVTGKFVFAAHVTGEFFGI